MHSYFHSILLDLRENEKSVQGGRGNHAFLHTQDGEECLLTDTFHLSEEKLLCKSGNT